MKALERFLSKWLLPFAKVLESNTQMKAVRQGMMALVPITLVGAVPVLFQQLGGIPKLPSWIAAVSNYINNITSPIYFATFGLMSVYVAVFVALLCEGTQFMGYRGDCNSLNEFCCRCSKTT